MLNEIITDEYFEHQSILVDPAQQALRIDKFLMERIAKVSRNRIQNLIRSGSVRVNDREIKPNYKVKGKDQISIVLPYPPFEGESVVPEEMPLNIIYEDEDLLVLNKPAGLVVHPGVGHRSGTLVNGLAYYFRDLPLMEGNAPDRPGLVHRIDKNTSGLMLIAKTDFALTHLAKQFFYHTIERTYYALVWGEPDPPSGAVNAHIGRDPRHWKKFAAYPDGETGKWAVTHFRVLEPLYYVSLVQCNLETGRTHQIRVHLEHLGHPLFNDERYGGDRIVKGTIFSKYKSFVERCFESLPRHGLHAKSLGFEHPRSGKWLSFDSELPEDMATTLDLWRNYVQGKKLKKEG
jgi:23S rRNA pseudouridine1911/1915/1917 synthase